MGGDLTNNFPPTPELERITFYPNYPIGPRGQFKTLYKQQVQEKKLSCYWSICENSDPGVNIITITLYLYVSLCLL